MYKNNKKTKAENIWGCYRASMASLDRNLRAREPKSIYTFQIVEQSKAKNKIFGNHLFISLIYFQLFVNQNCIVIIIQAIFKKNIMSKNINIIFQKKQRVMKDQQSTNHHPIPQSTLTKLFKQFLSVYVCLLCVFVTTGDLYHLFFVIVFLCRIVPPHIVNFNQPSCTS